MSEKTNVGLVGLGLVGTALAKRLLGAGLKVTGFDIDATRREAFAALGGSAVATVGEVASPSTRARAVKGMPGIDASSQVLPSSRVTLMTPLLKPAQMIPRPTDDAASVSMAPAGKPPGCGAAVSGGGVIPFGQLMSGESFRQ